MPHCENCNHFYPATMPAGCPMCDTRGFHKLPYCQFCGQQHKVKEADADGKPLRPDCPTCGRGPLIPSAAELKRRLTLNPKLEPVVQLTPTTVIKDGVGTAVEINGLPLAELSIKRTHGPVELYVKSEAIEAYMAAMSTNYGAAGGVPRATVFSPGHPYHGHSYYSIQGVGVQFYDVAGRIPYVFGQYGATTSLPGLGRITGNSIDMAFLQTAGLRNGVTFRFPVVLDDGSIKLCLNTLNDGLISFYMNLMRPVAHSCIIAVRTMAPGALTQLAEPKAAHGAKLKLGRVPIPDPTAWTPTAGRAERER